MNVARYIVNVVTGRIAHWNDTNNQLVSIMWQRTEEHLQDPLRTVLRRFIVASNSIMGGLLGPDMRRRRFMKPNPSRLPFKAIAQMHVVILEALVGVYTRLNPSL